MLPTLDEFLEKVQASKWRLGNSYVREPGFRGLYVRYGSKLVGRQIMQNVIVLANITAHRPGKGAFKKLIAKLRQNYPANPIYIENVLEPKFEDGLKRLGFEALSQEFDEGPPSYFMPAKE